MNRLYVPTIGDEMILAEDWSFDLHSEYRNSDMWQMMTGQEFTWQREDVKVPVTLPAGTILKVDRIYIRKGVGEYDSITFWMTDCPNKEWAPKKKGGTSKFKARFWVKLKDANKIVFR